MVGDTVWFRGMDPWYHMRLVDNLIANFPHLTAFDPFTGYPDGIRPPFHPLTDRLIAATAILLGGGAPSASLVDKVGAFFPAVLGALTVIPVYFVGRALFGRVAGVAAAFVLAILPGEFLSRTLLGFADHHVSEAFFATCTLLFLVLATRRVTAHDIRLSTLREGFAPGHRGGFILTALSGISLGLYLLAWRGGVLLLLVLFAYVAVRAVVDYVRKSESDDVIIVCSTAVIIGGAMVLPVVSRTWTPALFIAALLAAALSPVILRFMSRYARSRGWSTRTFAAVLIALGVIASALVAVAAPSALSNAINALRFILPTREGLSITEMHPLFFPSGEFSLRIGWTNFVTVLPLSILGLVLLLRDRRRSENHIILFAVWSTLMLLAVLSQRRFGYYYAGSAALLVGYLTARIWATDWVQARFASMRRHISISGKGQKKSELRALKAQQREKQSSALGLVALAAALVLVVVVPSADMAHNFAAEPSLMSPAWSETLDWLAANTDEPMGPDAYTALYDAPARGEEFAYPDTAYSIMAWWDYGHWLTRISLRIPVCNPFQQNARVAAGYFLSQEESDAEARLASLDSRYIIVDAKTAITSFHGVALWGGDSPEDYRDVYTQTTPTGATGRIVLYYPEYFQAMLARLFAFSAEESIPEQYEVIHYDLSGPGGDESRTIVGLEKFDTYDEARTYIEDSEDPHTALVSSNPFASCVPLNAMDGYSLVFESESLVSMFGKRVPEVRIFEYSGS